MIGPIVLVYVLVGICLALWISGIAGRERAIGPLNVMGFLAIVFFWLPLIISVVVTEIRR